jgi:hypothetical protein
MIITVRVERGIPNPDHPRVRHPVDPIEIRAAQRNEVVARMLAFRKLRLEAGERLRALPLCAGSIGGFRAKNNSPWRRGGRARHASHSGRPAGAPAPQTVQGGGFTLFGSHPTRRARGLLSPGCSLLRMPFSSMPRVDDKLLGRQPAGYRGELLEGPRPDNLRSPMR